MADTLSGGGIRSVFAAVRTSPVPRHYAPGECPAEWPAFVTISREGGAGGHTIGTHLVERLNELDPGEVPWMLWDKNLVAKIAADRHIAQEAVESLEASSRTWMQEFISSLSLAGDATEAQIYKGVATTIRALAQKGRVVIVGRGGVYITRNMPGSIHLRLVAPLHYRIRFMAKQLNESIDAAAEHVHQLDRQRKAFFHRFWPQEILSSECFTLTINTAQVEERRAVECVIPLVLPAAQVIGPGRSADRALAGM